MARMLSNAKSQIFHFAIAAPPERKAKVIGTPPQDSYKEIKIEYELKQK